MVPVPGLPGLGAYPGLVFTITTSLMSPVITDPLWVTLLETMTPMKAGSGPGGGGVEFPVSVDQ